MSWITRNGYEDSVMNEHDLCECERCHNRGDHDNLLEWKDSCDACAKENALIDHENGEHDRPFHHYSRCSKCFKQVEALAFHATFEFTFSVGDVKAAEEWARRNNYRYDDVSHLLHDAMEAGVIHPQTWKAA